MKKENIGVIISFVIVAGLIGLVVYTLMHKTIQENPLDGITSVDTSVNTEATNGATQGDQQTPQKNMEPNKNVRILSNFTPVTKVSNLEKIDTVIGKGEEVKAGATVSVQYTGAVAATGVIFQ